ncbi:BlaI/MecI/CopY family transcriptional regulator [Nonomuraea sp. SMC257]|uniref:BlaI/MecI/CopY family transcriptional regulator n=1 Tax=Nonomuraea montanisoli TaxID=2741721 RepID=A0A7Y6M4V8_9ACTN|nr:BlaI/MecI/CopY family transcriptional regulator [Nonomuraea montanisoli]
MRGFGELEAAIMEVVWAADAPLPVREVTNRLRPGREPAFTTVQTVMDILYRKGWVDRELQGRGYRYWAKAGREDYVAGLMASALQASPDRAAALARFVEGMDQAEIDELRAALAAARADEPPP